MKTSAATNTHGAITLARLGKCANASRQSGFRMLAVANLAALTLALSQLPLGIRRKIGAQATAEKNVYKKSWSWY
ncbi:MAG: hypothetical protein U5N55_02750 [Cypionkella sp.]|nr:hypothetical protein [Cypionkella sp.]